MHNRNTCANGGRSIISDSPEIYAFVVSARSKSQIYQVTLHWCNAAYSAACLYTAARSAGVGLVDEIYGSRRYILRHIFSVQLSARHVTHTFAKWIIDT